MTERHRLVKASSSDMSRKYLKWILVTGFIAGGMIASVLISLFIGEKSFGFLDVIDIIGGTGDATGRDIFLVHRLPRMILAFAAGGALSLAGVILQGIYRNPLVSPYTLGVSGGAAVGVTVVMVLGLHHFAGSMILPVAGFAGAVAAISVIYVLSFHGGKTHIPSMLLTGVMVSFVASSSTMFLKSVASREGLHGIVFWMMGSLEESNMSLVYTALWTALAALLTSHLFTGPLNALRLGQVKAGHLGINTEVTIRILFVLASLLVGIVSIKLTIHNFW